MTPARHAIRVFCDANILFAACKPDGAVRRLVLLLLDRAAAASSPYALREAADNLRCKRPQWLVNWPDLAARIQVCDPLLNVSVPGLPPKDLPILQAAAGARCSHLLTGDQRHFGPLMGRPLHGVRVVSPRMLAEELDRLGWIR